jgi:hypothetical protein
MLMFVNGRNTALAVAVASRVPSGSPKRPSRWPVVCPMRSTWPRAMTRAIGVLKIAHQHLEGWHHHGEALRDAGGYPHGIDEHGAYETALYDARPHISVRFLAGVAGQCETVSIGALPQ